VEVLDASTVDTELGGTAWERHGSEIVSVRRGADFADSLAFVNAVGMLAEEMDHHPDVDIHWNVVTLRLSTHTAGGITRRDLELARRIDALTGRG
jgi:4a-hydroxytetrahydrobiopterin dehydratase